MNGAQDLGGQMGFGAIDPEPDEPTFHEDWERRAFALTLAMGFTGQWNIDQARSARESLPPAQYLASSYYEIWFEGLNKLLIERGLVDAAQPDAARRSTAPAGIRALAAADVDAALARGGPSVRAARAPARFAAGQVVRTRVMNPLHHTRLPRYARGRVGTIVAVHGAHVFPDASARGAGDDPQWLYTVRFDAGQLWGPDTTASSVCLDCWEPYLDSIG